MRLPIALDCIDDLGSILLDNVKVGIHIDELRHSTASTAHDISPSHLAGADLSQREVITTRGSILRQCLIRGESLGVRHSTCLQVLDFKTIALVVSISVPAPRTQRLLLLRLVEHLC